MMVLQAAVDPLDGVAFVLGDDPFLYVGVNLLVHEVLQLGQIIIWKVKKQQMKCSVFGSGRID